MNKKAFTLAEVLLTLAIIGVVAALTIPAVITKVTQDQYVVGLKKAYNTLKAVQREAIQENGPMEDWDWSLGGSGVFVKYFKPHFDILKDCGTLTDDGCLPNGYVQLNKTNGVNYNTTEWYKIVTSDGISFGYRMPDPATHSCKGQFFVDVNGKKSPNQYGRDAYGFYVFPNKLGIKPQGTIKKDDTESSYTTQEVNTECSPTGGGGLCAAKVLSEGAMNY